MGGPQAVEISYTGNAEDFKIEDFLFDINEIQVDKLNSTVKDAIARVSEKCTDVKVQSFYVEIDSYGKPEISISIDGKLKSNGIKDDFYCRYDLQGKFKSM